MPRRAASVLATSLLARAPQGMAPLAVVLLVEERTGSIAAAGLASGAWGLGVAVGQPLWARPAGRGRAGAWVAAIAAAQSAVVAALALIPWTAAAAGAALAGVGGLLGPPVTSVARTMWPQLAPEPRALDRLFTLDATSQEVIWVAGPAVVGVLVTASGPPAALLATALAGGLGGLWFGRVIARLWRPHPPFGRAAEPLLRQLATPWLALAVMAVGLGTAEVAVPAAAIVEGHRDDAGWLLAVWSLGSLVGGLVAARRPSAADPAGRVAPLFCLIAAGGAATALTWQAGPGWFAGVLFLSGIGLAPALAAVYGVVSRVAPPARRTEAFAIGTTFVLTGLATGAALGGLLSDRSPTLAFSTATVAYLLAATSWWLWRQRTRSTRPSSHTGSAAS